MISHEFASNRLHTTSHRREVLWKPHYQVYRRNLLLPPALAAVWMLMIFPGRDSPGNVRFMLLLYGEVLLPPLLGWIAAGLLLSDPCRELLLTAPRPVWRVVLERLVLLAASAFLSWGILLLVTWFLADRTMAGPVEQIFLGGAATSLAFASVGLWAALRSRNTLGGGLVVAALWAAGLIFRQALLGHPLGQIVHPFLTLEASESPIWSVNCLILCLTAIMLTVLALRLTRDEEPLLPTEGTEEVV